MPLAMHPQCLDVYAGKCINFARMRRLEKITQASIMALQKQNINIGRELKELLDDETWNLPSEHWKEKGFATSIVGETTEKAAASAKKALFNLVHD